MNHKKIPVIIGLLLLSTLIAGGCAGGSSDGSNVPGFRQLTSGGQNSSFYPNWSPDGKTITYEIAPRDSESGLGSYGIWVMKSDGSGKKQLLQGDGGMLGSPQYSPDGKKIIYHTRPRESDFNEIWIMDKDGSNNRLLSESRSVFKDFPSWSPDGSKIAYTQHNGFSWIMSELWVMNSNGTGATRLAGGLSDFVLKGWSPDSKKIVFASDNSIQIVNADGTGLVKLAESTDVDYNQPDWSPDGKKIAFQMVSEKEDNKTLSAIGIMDSDSSQMQTVFDDQSMPEWNGKFVETPKWSPDGRSIAFGVGYYKEGFDIWVYQLK